MRLANAASARLHPLRPARNGFELIRRVAVLGAGTMGSRIAAHFVNAGFEVVLLDRTKDLAASAIAVLRTAKPPAFYDIALAETLQVESFDGDLSVLRDCDWVIEAVAEDLDIKQGLLWNVIPYLSDSVVLSTNTSGLPIAQIAEVLPDDLRRRWLGVHFFNPPRYMRLVEIIPTTDTGPAVVREISGVVEEQLGKTVVLAKDTPNFIANRMGLFTLLNTAKLMMELDATVEQVDAWTGSLIGWPSTATFRLMDLIGIDVLAKMSTNFDSRLRDERSDVKFPPFLKALVERGWLGQKTGHGVYRGAGDKAEALDWRTLEYQAVEPVAIPDAWRRVPLLERLQVLVRESPFHARFLPELWAYAANRVPEIADTAEAIDTAMQAGFNWELGPFAMRGGNVRLAPKALAGWKQTNGIVTGNAGASLIDIGDDVACVELHTKMNAIDDDVVRFVTETFSSNEQKFAAYVIYGDGAHFSAGANLQQILTSIERKDWNELGHFIRAFQVMTQAVKFSRVPVVATGFGLCLGGGAEVVMHAATRQVHAELTMGLVETGVGLIPGGGGCKEMAIRAADGLISWDCAFENIALARRFSSAAEAKKNGLLRGADGVTMNRDRLLRDAKAVALELVQKEHRPPVIRAIVQPMPAQEWSLPGQSEFDRHISGKLRTVFAGTSEKDLLEREVEVFLSLCGEAKTAERIAHTLKTGKPLRN